MRHICPEHSRTQVDKAGKTLVAGGSEAETDAALAVLNNWRAAHERPLSLLHAVLTEKLREIDASTIVAHRLKRLPSILNKLRPPSKMRLSRMQDIGGLRVVVPEIAQVHAVAAAFCSDPVFLGRLEVDDYLAQPKRSGYRGIHVIITHKDSEASAWDGMKVELQIRTGLQHAWATTLETAGTFLNQDLKSGRGETSWLDFFSLVSGAIALREECPIPEQYANLSMLEIHREVRQQAEKLRVVEKLQAYRVIMNAVENVPQADYFLLRLDTSSRTLVIRPFVAKTFSEAVNVYSVAEQGTKLRKGTQTVLVSVRALEELLQAYPNYFLDSKNFLEFLNAIVQVES